MSLPTGPRRNSTPAKDVHQCLEELLIHDSNSNIKAVKHFPSMAEALVKLMDEARSQGTNVQATRFVGMSNLSFSDQADFDRIADQVVLFAPLQGFQDKVADRSLSLHGVTLWNKFADAIVKIVLDRCAVQAARARAIATQKRPAIDVRRTHERPSDSELDRSAPVLSLGKHNADDVTTYRPGSSAAFKLIKQTDDFLGQHGSLSKEQLTEYAQVLEQTAYFQLFSLDIAFQACKQLLDRRKRLRAAIDNGDVATTSVLIHDLQVSEVSKPIIVDDRSDMEVGPIVPADEVAAAIEATLQD
ncbi:hypothetical protein C0992_004835 [Termitomyces sp. T32_za158]|nr:hypothetical protein C0992_004835 [Termitomyces sp. T32_za158]